MDKTAKDVAEQLRGELSERLYIIAALVNGGRGVHDAGYDADVDALVAQSATLCDVLASYLETGRFEDDENAHEFKKVSQLLRIASRLEKTGDHLGVLGTVLEWLRVAQEPTEPEPAAVAVVDEEEADAADEPETEQEAEAEPYGGASLGLLDVHAFPDRRAVRTFLLSEQFDALWTAISFGYAIETDHPRLPSSFASEVGVATCAAFEDMRVLAREAARAEDEPFRLVQSDYNAVDERRTWLGLLGSLGTICDMGAADALAECVDLHVDLIDQAQARGEAA